MTKKKDMTTLLAQANRGREYLEKIMPELKHRIILNKVSEKEAVFGLLLPHGIEGNGFIQYVHLSPEHAPKNFYNMTAKQAGEMLIFLYITNFVSEIGNLTAYIGNKMKETSYPEDGVDIEINFDPQTYLADCLYLFKIMLEADSKSAWIRQQFTLLDKVDVNQEGKKAWQVNINASTTDPIVRTRANKKVSQYSSAELYALSLITTLMATFNGSKNTLFAKYLLALPDLKTDEPREVPLDENGLPVVQLAPELKQVNYDQSLI